MKSQVIAFCSDEDGAVTIDWVVITAAVVGLSFAVVSMLDDGTSNVASSVQSSLSSSSTDTGLGD